MAIMISLSELILAFFFKARTVTSTDDALSQTVYAERRIISYPDEIYRLYLKYSYFTGCNAGEK